MKRSLLFDKVVLLMLAGFIAGTIQASQWWGDPIVKYKKAVDAAGPHYMNKGESDQYLFYPSSSSGSTAVNYLFSIKALTDAESADDVTPIFAFPSSTFYGIAWKGGAVSDDLGRIVTGIDSMLTSLPVAAPWTKDVTVFAITNGPTPVIIDGPDFSHDSKHLYAAVYASGQREKFVKFDVGDLEQAGEQLTLNAEYTTGVTRVRTVNAYYIGGKDLIYYGEGAFGTSAQVCVFDTVTETETVLTNGFADGTITADIMNVKVSGVGLGGQMYLYVQCNNGSLNIYELAADGMSVGRLVRAFSRTQMYALLGAAPADHMRSFEVTNDGRYAFIAFHGAGNLYVIYNRPRTSITWWRSPRIKYQVPVQTSGPHYMNKDESDQYLFYPSEHSSTSVINYLFSIETLTEAESADDVAPIFAFPTSNFHSFGWKGGAVSDDLRRIVTGIGTELNSLPVVAPWTKDETVFAITNGPTTVSIDGPDFSHDSKHLYAAVYASGQREKFVKFDVGDLEQAGEQLTLNAEYTTGVTRVRTVNAYYIGGKDLIYYGEGEFVSAESGKICVFDTVTETETVLTNGYADGTITADIMNVKVSGVGLGGQMYLYVQCNDGSLNVYELAADGMSVGRLARAFSADQMKALVGVTTISNMRSFEVTNDSRHAFITFHGAGCLNVIWTPLSALKGTVLMLGE